MSKKCLEFLQNSFLYDLNALNCEYSNYTENEILSELQKYREFVLSNIKIIQGEIIDNKNSLNVCLESDKQLPNEETYKQLMLYMDQVVICDPLFSKTEDRSLSSFTSEFVMGFSHSEKINKKELCEAVSYILSIHVLISNGFVVMLPLSIIHEGPNNIPLTYSNTAFSDVIPKPILDYLRSISQVYNTVPIENGLRVMMDKQLELGTSIFIDFTDKDKLPGTVFQFLNCKSLGHDKTTENLKLRIEPVENIDNATFRTWVNQSINQAANAHFDTIYKELLLSHECGCMYLTCSNIVSKILSIVIDKPSIESELATLALSLELPVTSQMPIEDLLAIRNNYGDAFHNFRTDLNSKLITLDTCKDRDSLKKQIDSISYEINNTSVHEVEKEYRKIASTLKLDALSFTGSLIASFTAGGLTPVGAVATFVKGVSDIGKYYTDVRENNGFFIWKLNKMADKYTV